MYNAINDDRSARCDGYRDSGPASRMAMPDIEGCPYLPRRRRINAAPCILIGACPNVDIEV